MSKRKTTITSDDAGSIDLSDGVDNDEAALAGRTLAERRLEREGDVSEEVAPSADEPIVTEPANSDVESDAPDTDESIAGDDTASGGVTEMPTVDEIYRRVLVRYVGPNMAVLGERVILQGETREVMLYDVLRAAENRPADFEIIDPATLDEQG
jgi:hypothetical protein